MDPVTLVSTPTDALPLAGSWLVLAFVLGLVHAFDADHVMALSVFATGRRRATDGMRAGLRWSLGHGLSLLVVGFALLALGRSLPPAAVLAAERMVGVVMIAIGAWVVFDLLRRRSHLHFHEHDGLPPHAHWHTHAAPAPRHDADGHQHEHAALMVGALHGLAGSAPILAVLPAAARSPWLGLGYLTLFAVGVAFAMAVVSGLLGHLAGRLSQRSQSRGLAALRACSATGSIALGLWLFSTA